MVQTRSGAGKDVQAGAPPTESAATPRPAKAPRAKKTDTPTKTAEKGGKGAGVTKARPRSKGKGKEVERRSETTPENTKDDDKSDDDGVGDQHGESSQTAQTTTGGGKNVETPGESETLEEGTNKETPAKRARLHLRPPLALPYNGGSVTIGRGSRANSASKETEPAVSSGSSSTAAARTSTRAARKAPARAKRPARTRAEVYVEAPSSPPPEATEQESTETPGRGRSARRPPPVSTPTRMPTARRPPPVRIPARRQPRARRPARRPPARATQSRRTRAKARKEEQAGGFGLRPANPQFESGTIGATAEEIEDDFAKFDSAEDAGDDS